MLGSQEHTLLHELREQIEFEFRKIGRPVVSNAADQEDRAESFASSVRSLASMKGLEAARSVGRNCSRSRGVRAVATRQSESTGPAK
jgi:hypothetical protein